MLKSVNDRLKCHYDLEGASIIDDSLFEK